MDLKVTGLQIENLIWLTTRDRWLAVEQDNEPSGSIQAGEFIDLLRVLLSSKNYLCFTELLVFQCSVVHVALLNQ
jgi:hypothetical protein